MSTHSPLHSRWPARISLACAAALLLGCPPKKLVLTAPLQDELVTTSSFTVDADLISSIDPTSISLEVDGVDLISELGLVAPFENESGVVMIGGSPVTVVDLDLIDPAQGRTLLHAEVDGLPEGAHLVRVAALSGAQVVEKSRDFQLVSDFALAASAIPAAGLAGGPVASGSEGTLWNASLGSPLSGAPVSNAQGELRTGFVAVAEALVAD